MTTIMAALGGMQIIESREAMENYEEHMTFPGHPLVKWLAKYLRFDPDVHAVFHRRRPACFQMGNKLIMHPALVADVRRQVVVNTCI